MTAAGRGWRRPGAAALAMIALSAIAACGEDQGDKPTPAADAPMAPTAVTLRASAQGKALALRAPSTVPAGPVRLSLQNSDKRPREAALVRVAGDQTVEQVLEFREAEDGRPFPKWFELAGGVATVAPGQTASVIQTLAPGTYYAIDALKDGPPDNPKIPSHARLGATARFVVTGPERSRELPSTPAAITAREYDFKITALKAGPNRVRFQNAGKEPHHAILFPVLTGKTFADAKRFLASERSSGPPPLDFERATGTTSLEGGGEQITELNLRAGTYAVVCFLTDRRGGKDHIAQGQIAEAIVR